MNEIKKIDQWSDRTPTELLDRPYAGCQHILYFAQHTCRSKSRTGIQRVAVQMALSLLPLVSIDFVKWDEIDGQLRYFNADDMDAFFRTKTWPEAVKVNRFAERRRYRFEDALPSVPPGCIWLVMPEISYLSPSGADIYASILAQAREYGIHTACAFYDLIPIKNPDYHQEGNYDHHRYVQELFKFDVIMPISLFSRHELLKYQLQTYGIRETDCDRAQIAIEPVPLATVNAGALPRGQASTSGDAERDLIVLLGTVEPRKRQVEVLRTFIARQIAERFHLRLVVIGSLHPKAAGRFNELLATNDHIEHVGYACEQKVQSLLARARFTVFASNDEGFGLPICESLAEGVPCVAANFGAMCEVGEGGGCLLVDVNDERALGDAIERLASDDALLERLRREIVLRPVRTWSEYGRDALRIMDDHSGGKRDQIDIVAAVEAAVRAVASGNAVSRGLIFSGEKWLIATPAGLGSECDAGEPAAATRVALLISDCEMLSPKADRGLLDRMFQADVWLCTATRIFERMVTEARTRNAPALLPTRCVTAPATALPKEAGAVIAELVCNASRRRTIATRETLLRSMGKLHYHRSPQLTLNIIISTYNRSSFVFENVRWILSFIGRFEGAVRLTVVDNASTDDTEERLQPFMGMPYFEFIRNAGNVGMLGNLHVCSTLLKAAHSWVIGDDDFILPSALETVVEAIKKDPYLPFVFLNFGVYHRAALGPEDRVTALTKDPILLAPCPSPTGEYRVRDIACEHDNLFTAIYPIVFRTDILSACFNYPFTGKPFSSLVESIPTTKIILETYAETSALWIAEVGIVGNAHNSWQRYRMRWHGMLMPLALELAREAGVDAQKLLQWSQSHRELFAEAKTLFPDHGFSDSFPKSAVDASFRVFRQRLEPQTAPSQLIQ